MSSVMCIGKEAVPVVIGKGIGMIRGCDRSKAV